MQMCPETSYHETEWTRGCVFCGTACFVKFIRLYIRTLPKFDSEWLLCVHNMSSESFQALSPEISGLNTPESLYASGKSNQDKMAERTDLGRNLDLRCLFSGSLADNSFYVIVARSATKGDVGHSDIVMYVNIRRNT